MRLEPTTSLPRFRFDAKWELPADDWETRFDVSLPNWHRDSKQAPPVGTWPGLGPALEFGADLRPPEVAPSMKLDVSLPKLFHNVLERGTEGDGNALAVLRALPPPRVGLLPNSPLFGPSPLPFRNCVRNLEDGLPIGPCDAF